MKIKNGIWFSPLIVIGLILILTYSCGEKEKDNNNPSGSLIDKDGNVYKSVTIGTRVWMVENLKTTKFNDGTEILNLPDINDWSHNTTGAYNDYGNIPENSKIYGRLYNWYAVNTGKLCPVGWHVSSYNDWTTMVNYLIANGYNYDGTNIEDKVAKSLGDSTHWADSSTEGSIGNTDYPAYRNKSGFTGLPGGNRLFIVAGGEFAAIGQQGFFWTSDEETTTSADYWLLDYRFSATYFNNWGKNAGFSVRCVKD